jgi:uroporphyrin-III C-methyltransferase
MFLHSNVITAVKTSLVAGPLGKVLSKLGINDPDKGKVFLVGAGPGDPGLLTLRGQELLKKATVVLYDALVPDQILDLANPKATKIYVGKRAGRHSMPQSYINTLLASSASKKGIVVRLKGGDPTMFGRGAEELLHLKEEGIHYEVVPGISAGFAVPVYAGIPLTYRGMSASSVAFISGHPRKKSTTIQVPRHGEIKTVIVYMGAKTITKIVESLSAANWPMHSSIAAVENGTRSNQKVVVSTLEKISRDILQLDRQGPILLIVGEVVKLRSSLQWFDELSSLP